MEARINKIILILGKRGTGKTYYGKEIIKTYQEFQPNMKILVMDTFDHPSYREIPEISLDLLKRWDKPATYRIYKGNKSKILDVISEYMYNSVIIFEDARKIIKKVLPKNVEEFIIDSKQKNLDLIFMYHGFTFCPLDLLRYADDVVMFKCANPIMRKNDILNFEEIYEAWKKIKNDPFPYAKKTINIE